MKTQETLTALLVFAVMRGATFADTVSFVPQKDNTLYQDAAGQISNGQGPYLYAGKTGAAALRRGLVAFDLASIPTNATVTDATLSMALSQPSLNSTPVDISLTKASRAWGEGASNAGDPGGAGIQAEAGDATWLHTFYDTSFWITPGGDFSATLSATTPVMQSGIYTWSGSGLLADVQAWVSNSATNFGWVILGNEIDSGRAQRFNTRENTNDPPRLTVTYQLPFPSPTPAAQTVNLSTRMRVQTGDNVGIGGFIITGTAPKHLLLRAIGPSLTQLGVPNALADPVLELHGPGAFATITNDNWRDDPAQESAILATGLAPSNNLESAIDVTLNPGAYTAIVSGKNNTVGVALIEAYDLSQAVLAKLANISTRAFVGSANDIVIAGFVLGNHSGADRIVVRGIGPSLTALGVANALANPTLELRDSNGALLIANNDWQENPAQAAELTAAGLAPTNQLESAIAATLPPGVYTALLAGRNNGMGVAVVEVYDRGAP
ncbi:MAG: hypothetical protein QOC70_1048 [Verrucomicrobiota bacterium]|jgi:hypothetical protein